ncbi:hypothetical protein [Rummeliibacillus suwonensis]|uniref:hypothetical protein n=1 Tax=Rummeliibacillus suwonensis TaxID=1306154 RepID=UPI0011B713BA|nr:hypothetical protein [Rummeliibacillus suwonensis]
MSPIGSTNKMLVPSGVATGRGDFNLSSSISTGDENHPTDGSVILQRNGGIQWILLSYRIRLIFFRRNHPK